MKYSRNRKVYSEANLTLQNNKNKQKWCKINVTIK